MDASVDIDTARDEDLVKVPFIELCPNTWLVPPVGEPVQIPETDQFVPAKIEKQVEALRKQHGPTLTPEAFGQIRNALAQADAALGEDAWRKALEALKGIASHAPTPHAALTKLVQARLDAIGEPVGWAFDDLEEGGAPGAERRAAVKALVEAVDVEVYGRKLPVLARMQAWLKAHAAGR